MVHYLLCAAFDEDIRKYLSDNSDEAGFVKVQDIMAMWPTAFPDRRPPSLKALERILRGSPLVRLARIGSMGLKLIPRHPHLPVVIARLIDAGIRPRDLDHVSDVLQTVEAETIALLRPVRPVLGETPRPQRPRKVVTEDYVLSESERGDPDAERKASDFMWDLHRLSFPVPSSVQAPTAVPSGASGSARPRTEILERAVANWQTRQAEGAKRCMAFFLGHSNGSQPHQSTADDAIVPLPSPPSALDEARLRRLAHLLHQKEQVERRAEALRNAEQLNSNSTANENTSANANTGAGAGTAGDDEEDAAVVASGNQHRMRRGNVPDWDRDLFAAEPRQPRMEHADETEPDPHVVRNGSQLLAAMRSMYPSAEAECKLRAVPLLVAMTRSGMVRTIQLGQWVLDVHALMRDAGEESPWYARSNMSRAHEHNGDGDIHDGDKETPSFGTSHSRPETFVPWHFRGSDPLLVRKRVRTLIRPVGKGNRMSTALRPLAQLFLDPNVMKIMFDCRRALRALQDLFGLHLVHVFDCQLAGTVTGHLDGDDASWEALAKGLSLPDSAFSADALQQASLQLRVALDKVPKQRNMTAAARVLATGDLLTLRGPPPNLDQAMEETTPISLAPWYVKCKACGEHGHFFYNCVDEDGVSASRAERRRRLPLSGPPPTTTTAAVAPSAGRPAIASGAGGGRGPGASMGPIPGWGGPAAGGPPLAPASGGGPGRPGGPPRRSGAGRGSDMTKPHWMQ